MRCIQFSGIQTDPLIGATKPDFVMINTTQKKKLPKSGFCRSGEQQRENQRKRKEWQVLRTCLRIILKRICWIVDFAVLVDHKVKMEKKNKKEKTERDTST